MNIDLLSAFAIGLLGAGHCLAMCGGISGMLLSALPKNTQHNKWAFVLSYHFGRILSYSVLGAIVGFTGATTAKNLGAPLVSLRLLSGLFLILLGLYLGQWLFLLTKIENAGKTIWKYISPLASKCMPVDTSLKALHLGIIWGWLPCGLIYSTLTWSIASGSALQGAFIMAAFGLGTLPAMISLSLGVFSLKTFLQSIYFRKTVAILMIFYGLYTVQVAYKAMI